MNVEIGDSFLIVFEEGKPSVIIGEYELCNSFEFGDVVICPGHDSITCYNKKLENIKPLILDKMILIN
jgi:hypothetical protein